ncbi:MAG: hypothetical protein EOM91_05330 [Sphingobacteriia bacterium]|nr:hypothetical protein [Sphingobacteriia bacterium]NCC38764.1 hypothetical protein [Gammaproteobacteria bacterium]
MSHLDPNQSRHNRRGAHLGVVILLLAWGAFVNPVTADSEPADQDVSPPWLGEPHGLEDGTPWLDEVRAQRQAREAMRESNRQAYEARRRAHNPRGAAFQEAWEEDVRRRRSANLERMDQERERFLNSGPTPPMFANPPWRMPWHSPHPPWTEPSGGPPGSGEPPLFAPPDWDNLWYFRGF